MLRRVTGAVRRWPGVVRMARVEGRRAGMWGGTERVRVKADVSIGRRGRRRGERMVEQCMLGCVGGDLEVDGVKRCFAGASNWNGIRLRRRLG